MANNQATDLRIVIAGAGMGGLTSALALAKKGFKHIDVYENASSLVHTSPSVISDMNG